MTGSLRRLRYALVSTMGLAFLLLGGCSDSLLEPRVTSPIDGKRVSASELNAQFEALTRSKEAEANADAEAAKLEVAQAAADLKTAMAKLAADHEQADIDYRRKMAELEAQAGVRSQTIASNYQTRAANRQAELDGIAAKAEAAGQQIERARQAELSAWSALKSIPVVGQAVSSFGLDPLVSAGIGVVGTGGLAAVTAYRGRKRTDQDYTDGQKDAQAAHAAELEAVKAGYERQISEMRNHFGTLALLSQPGQLRIAPTAIDVPAAAPTGAPAMAAA